MLAELATMDRLERASAAVSIEHAGAARPGMARCCPLEPPCWLRLGERPLGPWLAPILPSFSCWMSAPSLFALVLPLSWLRSRPRELERSRSVQRQRSLAILHLGQTPGDWPRSFRRHSSSLQVSAWTLKSSS